MGCHFSAYEKTSCCSSVCLQTSSCLEFLRFLRLQKESWRKQRPRDRFGEVFTCKSQTNYRCTSPRAPDAHRAVPNSFSAKGTMRYPTLLEPRKLILSTLQTLVQSPQLVSSASSLPRAQPFCQLTAPRPWSRFGDSSKKEGKDGSAGKGIRIRWPVARSRNAGLF